MRSARNILMTALVFVGLLCGTMRAQDIFGVDEAAAAAFRADIYASSNSATAALAARVVEALKEAKGFDPASTKITIVKDVHGAAEQAVHAAFPKATIVTGGLGNCADNQGRRVRNQPHRRRGFARCSACRTRLGERHDVVHGQVRGQALGR